MIMAFETAAENPSVEFMNPKYDDEKPVPQPDCANKLKCNLFTSLKRSQKSHASLLGCLRNRQRLAGETNLLTKVNHFSEVR